MAPLHSGGTLTRRIDIVSLVLEDRDVTSSEGITQQRMRLGTTKVAFTNDTSKNVVQALACLIHFKSDSAVIIPMLTARPF